MQAQLSDLTYFRTKDDIIFYVKGYWHPPGYVIAIPVFFPDEAGNRVHSSGRRYRKEVDETFQRSISSLLPHYQNPEIPRGAARVPLADIVELFDPREAFQTFMHEERFSFWQKIANSLIEIADISPDDIGIFGSYLVGLAQKEGSEGIVKDVDFLVYGLDNCRRLKNGGLIKIRRELKLGCMSREHLEWHAKKYGSYLNNELTNFSETLKRKWPSLQVGPQLLSTIRFVYKPKEIPHNPVTSRQILRVSLSGTVVEAERTSFMPRIFVIDCEGVTVKVLTYFWALYCPVKEGDNITVTGMLHEYSDPLTVSVDDCQSGIWIY